MMVALDQFVGRTRLGRGIRAVVAGLRDGDADGRQHRPSRDAHVLARRHHGGRAPACCIVFFFEVTKFNVGFIIGIKAFTAAVLGGIGNLRGALLGGLMLGLIENYGSALWGAEWKDADRLHRARARADGAAHRAPR